MEQKEAYIRRTNAKNTKKICKIHKTIDVDYKSTKE